MKTNGTMTVKNKKYSYAFEKKRGGVVRVTCKAAKVDQDFLAEDFSSFLLDLPALIVAEQEYSDTQDSVIRFRVTPTAKKQIEKKAMENGYSSVSEYARDRVLA